MIIENARFGEERALYGLQDITVRNCRFEGEEDGESALKECRNVTAKNCVFRLRYPLWHVRELSMENCSMESGARAPVWYGYLGRVVSSAFDCAKFLRECVGFSLKDCKIVSPEAGWRCVDLSFDHCEIESLYFLLAARGIILEGGTVKGNYAFQYADDISVTGAELDAKDMFWHASRVNVKDCRVSGEYLAWYSEDVTFENCDIYGTQPFCYCKKLTLKNCTLHGCDRAFEYSDVNAELFGKVDSIKNPRSGKIVCDGVGELIKDAPAYPCDAEVIVRK